MIKEIYKTNKGAGKYCVLWIANFFGANHILPNNVCNELIFNRYGLEDLLNKNADDLTLHFPKRLWDEFGDRDYHYIHQVQIDLDKLPEVFEHILDKVIRTPSGDDDTFDYWPDEVRTAKIIAEDFDRITNKRFYTTALVDRYKTLLIKDDELDQYATDHEIPQVAELEKHLPKQKLKYRTGHGVQTWRAV